MVETFTVFFQQPHRRGAAAVIQGKLYVFGSEAG